MEKRAVSQAACSDGSTRAPQFDRIKTLGEGSFGTVDLVYDRVTKNYFALKTIPRRCVTKYIQTEIVNHSLLRHPHVIQLGEVFATSKKVCIQMEYANGGTLFDRLQEEEVFEISHARWFFQQVILALDYCHKMGVANRDIKLENCLLHNEENLPLPLIKLCDFGYSKADFSSAARSKVGTLCAMAPEVLIPSGSYDGKKADLWSAGVLLYTMVTGRRPFDFEEDGAKGAAMAAQCLQIANKMQREQYPAPVCPSLCKDLIAKLLKPKPEDRISMKEVMEHPWFQSRLPKNALKMNDYYCSLPAPNATRQAEGVAKLLECVRNQ